MIAEIEHLQRPELVEQDSSCVIAPWEENPYQLVSWWQMKPFPISRLLRVVRGFASMPPLPEGGEAHPLYSPEQDKAQREMIENFRNMAEDCEQCSLTSSADQFIRMAQAVKENITWGKLHALMPEAMNRIEDECKRHIVQFIEQQHVQYFLNAQFFDPADSNAPKVSVAFPSAAEDIAEAGKCLACGRSTACVMHLGRVAEVSLKALASALGIGVQNDWGKYLSEIDKELQKRFKTAGARSPDEQFYSEAHVTFDGVRRAWRNPTMHIEKTYTVERAEEILIAVRSLMRHLAAKLHE